MVKVTFFNNNTEYIGFKVVGHADYSLNGKDIVCAAISSVVIGGLNSLINQNDFDIKIEEGYVNCYLKENHQISQNDSNVLRTIRIQLETIADVKSKNIQICEERIN